MFVKTEGPSGHAKINSDEPKHALGLVQDLRTIATRLGLRIEMARGRYLAFSASEVFVGVAVSDWPLR
jgi:hypothetical protein